MQYAIRPGDTLSSIARSYGCSLEALLACNPALRANPNRIRAGVLIDLPDARPAASDGPVAAAAEAMTGAVSTAAQAVGSAAAAVATAAATWVLGQLSARYETGGRGPGTVSNGTGDAGGVSYGSYQMTSRPNGGTVARFVGSPDFPFRARFAGQEPGSAAFTAAWKALAAEQPEAFHKAQHEFIRRTHFDPMVTALRSVTGLNVAERSPALQDCCWSTAVQHGPANPIMRKVCVDLNERANLDPGEGAAFDEAMIRAIYAERGRRGPDGSLAHFGRNSPEVQAGVAKRFERELQDALKMLQAQGVS